MYAEDKAAISQAINRACGHLSTQVDAVLKQHATQLNTALKQVSDTQRRVDELSTAQNTLRSGVEDMARQVDAKFTDQGERMGPALDELIGAIQTIAGRVDELQDMLSKEHNLRLAAVAQLEGEIEQLRKAVKGRR